MGWKVQKTAEFVAKNSSEVRIDRERLVRFVNNLFAEGVYVPLWNHTYHFCGKPEDMVSYFFVLDSINFCFWPEPKKRKWECVYHSQRLSGYYALAASIKMAIKEGIPITDARYLAKISLDELKQVLGGQGELQLLEERRTILNQLGKVLIQDYKDSACNLVEDSGNSAVRLVELLSEKLESYRDIGKYLDQRVFFFKRAQILVADLYGAFEGSGFGSFMDIDMLSCFADYKLPQVLRHMGILRYSQSLAEKVDQGVLLEAGCSQELEIRACTICAVELIREELKRIGVALKAFEIDWILWNLAQYKEFKVKPYHRTLTLFY
ncbi:MAG: queuosine salvage family protein [Thermodesulfobacteriota bacterium]|nr:queuosine salvage family protein [Thermodesulfobacteriota bacterium]